MTIKVKFVTSALPFLEEIKRDLLPLLRSPPDWDCVIENLLQPDQLDTIDLVVLCPTSPGIDMAISRARRLGSRPMALLAEDVSLNWGRLRSELPETTFLFVGALNGSQPDTKMFPGALRASAGRGITGVASMIRRGIVTMLPMPFPYA